MKEPLPDTLQGFFDKVVELINKQGKPSIDDNDQCLYRGPGDTKCAIGFFLDDTSAKIGDEKRQTAACFNIWPDNSYRALALRLQYAHDSTSTCSNFLAMFNIEAVKIGNEFGLNTEKLDALSCS